MALPDRWGVSRMAGTWQPLVNPPPFSASTMLLQTDGSVMCHVYFSRDWWKLTPDASGSYVKGSWTKLASMAHSRLYYASAVLNGGRGFVAGGEYSGGGGIQRCRWGHQRCRDLRSVPRQLDHDCRTGLVVYRRRGQLRAGRWTRLAGFDLRQEDLDLRSRDRQLERRRNQGRRQLGGNLDAAARRYRAVDRVQQHSQGREVPAGDQQV